MIKYINLVKEKEEYRKNQNSPTHKIVVVHTNGDKQYIGAVWYSDTKGFGSISLSEGVTFNIPDTIKVYKPKVQPAETQQSEVQQNSAINEPAYEYPQEDINPDDIPFN